MYANNKSLWIYIYMDFWLDIVGWRIKKKKNRVNTSFSTLSFGYSILLLPPSACCSFEEQYIERWPRDEKKNIYMRKRVGEHYAFNRDGFSFTFLVCVYFWQNLFLWGGFHAFLNPVGQTDVYKSCGRLKNHGIERIRS